MMRLRVAAPPWTQADWEKAVSFKLVQGEVTIAPIRHPANDNTWTVGVYVPIEHEQLGHGHKLWSYSTKCETYEEALKAASFMSYDPKRQYLGFDLPESEREFWDRVQATYG